jgi:hypothetical protein
LLEDPAGARPEKGEREKAAVLTMPEKKKA